MSESCSPSVGIGNQLPHSINNTYICGVNPFNSAPLLQKCCQGPVTNITSPAPETGPLSDSWPTTCLAYCAILLHPYYSDQDDAVHENFTNCLASDSSFFGSIVCTEADGLAPNECAAWDEVAGCTNSKSQTWDGSTYVSGAASATMTGMGSSIGSGNGIAQSTVVVTRSASAVNLETSTPVPSASPTRSAAAPILRRTGILKVVVASLVVQVCLFSL